jgi:flagellar basal-body rod protein FlgC
MDAFSVALSGVNTANMGVAVNANNVANANSEDFRAKRMDQAELAQGGTRPEALRESETPTVPGGSNVDYATEFVGLMAQSASFEANLKVMETQNQLLGQTLDLKA